MAIFQYICVCSVSYHAREDLCTNSTATRYEALSYQRGPVSFQTRASSEGRTRAALTKDTNRIAYEARATPYLCQQRRSSVEILAAHWNSASHS